MDWLNIYGFIFIAVIMVPNVLYAIKCKDGFENKHINKFIETAEQIGRFGCVGFMIFNIPGTWRGWPADEAFVFCLIVNTLLSLLYTGIWIAFFKKPSLLKTMALSFLPPVIFLFSGIMSRSLLLIASSLIFAPAHIMISYRNAK